MTKTILNAYVVTSLALATSLITGCSTQKIVAFNDHGTRPLVSLETIKVKSILGIASGAEHQFWLCRDEGDALNCNLQCGGKTDLACPAATGATSNVR